MFDADNDDGSAALVFEQEVGKKRKATCAASRRVKQQQAANDTSIAGHRSQPAHLTVIGVGVDLSIDTIERLSAVPGAKYISVISAGEFDETVVADFDFDTTPIAFNIRISLPTGLVIEKAYGSAELNGLPAGAKTASISAEFPVPLVLQPLPSVDGQAAQVKPWANGALYLFQLTEQQQEASAAAAGALNQVVVSWHDRSGEKHEHAVQVSLVELGEGCQDNDLRKAVALMRFVNTLTEYITGGADEADDNTEDEDDNDDGDEDDGNESVENPQVLPSAPLMTSNDNQQQEWTADLILAIPSLADHMQSPPAWPKKLLKQCKDAWTLHHLRRELLMEIEQHCGDTSLTDTFLTTKNAHVLQMLDKCIELEKKEIDAGMKKLPPMLRLVKRQDGGHVDDEGMMMIVDDAHTAHDAHPRGFVCPISLALMTDPVMAADGHSYQRSAIVQHLKQSWLSPATNKHLANKKLTENFALRSAIQDYVAVLFAKKSTSSRQEASSTEGKDESAATSTAAGIEEKKQACVIC